MIDLFRPYLPQEAIDEVNHTLKTRWLGQGPKVDLFEKYFEDNFGVNFAVSLNSGTSALETAYDLIGLKEGDEVISTPLTCTATNLPLLNRGVKIVWADILEDSLTLDPSDVKRKITGNTKAIVNVHLGGIESDIGTYFIPTVADAAQALGVFNGDYTCCSFQAIKHITTGDGGMLICPNEEAYNKAKLLRWFGIDREKKIKNNWQAYTQRQMTFDIDTIGYKRQMTDIAASMGIGGLKKYNYIIDYRKELFNLYKDKLEGLDGIKIVDGKNNTCWLCTVLVERRDDFAKMMFESNIDTNLVQVRNDAFKIFGGKRADLPVMNSVESKYISLPLGMHINEGDVNYICSIIKGGW